MQPTPIARIITEKTSHNNIKVLLRNLLSFYGGYMLSIGIDIGGTKIAVGIVDGQHRILIKETLTTKAYRNADEIVESIARLCQALPKRIERSLQDICHIGIAAPGAVDKSLGVVRFCSNIPMSEYPLVEKMRAHLSVERIFLDNDANAAAIAEAKMGAGQGAEDFVMVTLGTGVGGGILIGGKPLYGSYGFGAELGHVTLQYGGRPCSCGRRGCFEAYSSATALTKMTKEKMRTCRGSDMWRLCGGALARASAHTAFRAARGGDRPAKELIHSYIGYLGAGLASVVNLFDPRVICLGGGLSGELLGYLPRLRSMIKKEQYGKSARTEREQTTLEIAALGNDAGIMGAVLLGN